MRLWHAIEQRYLVPFDYYVLHDGRLSGLMEPGLVGCGELEKHYLGDTRRANLILSQFYEFYREWRLAPALGFCVSIAHAQFMAEAFDKAGIPV